MIKKYKPRRLKKSRFNFKKSFLSKVIPIGTIVVAMAIVVNIAKGLFKSKDKAVASSASVVLDEGDKAHSQGNFIKDDSGTVMEAIHDSVSNVLDENIGYVGLNAEIVEPERVYSDSAVSAEELVIWDTSIESTTISSEEADPYYFLQRGELSDTGTGWYTYNDLINELDGVYQIALSPDFDSAFYSTSEAMISCQNLDIIDSEIVRFEPSILKINDFLDKNGMSDLKQDYYEIEDVKRINNFLISGIMKLTRGTN